MRIGFLLGSGVSIPAEMARTDELTNQVLSHTEDYVWNGYRFLKFNPGFVEAPEYRDRRKLIPPLLQILKECCQDYFVAEDKSRIVNYEDVYFAARQLHEHISVEYENPAIEPFAQEILRRLLPSAPQSQNVCLDPSKPDSDTRRSTLKQTADLACKYISDVVEVELSKTPGRLDHLNCLIDAMRDEHFEGCDVFTLNHDVVIERVLDNEGLSFVDGFGSRKEDVAWWEPDTFNQLARHYLVKLHGSVNWVMYDHDLLAKPLNNDRDHAVGDKWADSRATLLVGTFNKIRDYFLSPYFELASVFRRQLGKIEWLIISGYGFGDKGINTALQQWFRERPQAKLLVLHADRTECRRRARGAIRNLWDRYQGMRLFIDESYLDTSDRQTLRLRYGIG